MRRLAGWVLLIAAILAFRLTHRQILWVEEAYPSAAAIQMQQHGLALYRDVQFDKPPLSAAIYMLWQGRTGWPLRAAGAAYVTLCCWVIYCLARRWWSLREAWLAAVLLAFYLTFGIPAAVMAMAPDLLTLLPVLVAVLAFAYNRPWWAGVSLGLAVGFNGKAVLLLPLFGLRALPGFAAALIAAHMLFSPPGMLDQVWRWGAAYSRNSPMEAPWREGALRTLAWCGFQATAVIGAVWYFFKDQSPAKKMMLGWTALSLVIAGIGLRFSPRYYLVLLAPVVLCGARGLALMNLRWRAAALALLLIPGVRFGGRFLRLAADPSGAGWADAAMNLDSAAAARQILTQAKPGDTILVWGYRPDLLTYTRLRLGTPFLDSQPLTGVLADRHLTRGDVTFPELAARNRARLSALSPTWIADGLGAYNPALAISNFPDLAAWLAQHYQRAGAGTPGTIIYRRRP